MNNFNFFKRFLVIELWDALWKTQVIAAFAKRFLINIISTYANLLQHFIFARFLLVERRLWKVCTMKGDSYWLQF